jgi:hypothetical protein
MDTPSDDEVIAIYARRALRFRLVFFAFAILVLFDVLAVSRRYLDNEGAGFFIFIGLVIGVNIAWAWFRRCPRCGHSFGRRWVISTCPACEARLIPKDG